MTIGATSQKLFTDFQVLGEYLQGRNASLEVAGSDLYTLDWGSGIVERVYSYVLNFFYRLYREGFCEVLTCYSQDDKLRQADVIFQSDFTQMIEAYHRWIGNLYVDKLPPAERRLYLSQISPEDRRAYFADLSLHYHFVKEHVAEGEWEAYTAQIVGLALIKRELEERYASSSLSQAIATTFSERAHLLTSALAIARFVPQILDGATNGTEAAEIAAVDLQLIGNAFNPASYQFVTS